MNCEDVAMSILVATHSGLPPVYVRGSLGDAGVFGGISTRGGHMGARSDCLNDMMALFRTGAAGVGAGSAATAGLAAATWDGGSELLHTNRVVAARASSFWANQPATWMEFLAADLPIPIPAQVLLLIALVALVGKALSVLGRALLRGGPLSLLLGRGGGRAGKSCASEEDPEVKRT